MKVLVADTFEVSGLDGLKTAGCEVLYQPDLAGEVLALDRRIPDNVAYLRAGWWNKNEYSKAHGLYGGTLGLLGWSLNVQETENVIFVGAEAAVARIDFDGEPPADLLREVERGCQDILSLQVVKI